MQQYLDRHRFLKGIYLMVRRYFDHHVGRDSAALTYYLLFALFPLLIFLSNLVGIMSVDISGFLHEIRAFIPQEALDIIEQYLIYVGRDSSPRLLWFSLIFSIYFPYRAASSLLGSVRRAYGEHRPTQFLRYQVKLLIYTLSLILMIVLSIGLSVVGGRVLNYVSSHLSAYITLSDGFIRLWSSLRFVWLVLSFLFSYYVENIARYSVIYGTLGAVIVLLLWLYLASVMLIMGAEFNSVLMVLRKQHTAEAEENLGETQK